MKKLLLMLLLLQTAHTAVAQDYKLFINDNGSPTNSIAAATSYILVTQRTDSLWLMQQYDMENTMLQMETFKDRNLKIPNGKYASYRKLSFYNKSELKEMLKGDTINCIMTEGEFKDGKKEGKWTDYFIGGKKREEAYYKNGVLDGHYNAYNDDRSSVALSGNYVNGKRDGEWNMMNLNGQVIEKDEYRDGKVRSRKLTISNYNSPKPPKGFESYINNSFGKVAMQPNMRKVLVSFDITTDGRVNNLHVALPGHDDDQLIRRLFGVIKNSPLWKPANTGDESKPIEDFAVIWVEIDNGEVITKVLDNAEARTLFYNLHTEIQ